MNEETMRHLELIQGVVTRLAHNSFAYKGWTIALVAAIFALAAGQAQPAYLLVALIPTLAFWGLDGYYLRQERLFRQLYDAVRKAPSSDLEKNPFSMDTSPYVRRVATWWGVCWSKTVAWLYGPMALIVLAVAILAFALR